jgi:hypothetical protein
VNREPGGTCLNCGAELRGAFCSNCGQRATAAFPTVGEMIGDAWQELSGWDGRFVRTFRVLLGQPGALTIDTLEGRRARYISPVRLYLVASVVYFLCAVAVPNLRTPAPPVIPGSDIAINIGPNGATILPPEQRAEVLRRLERAPWWAKAILRPVVVDPVGFRQQFIVALPRVLFALVPAFAGIVAIFYRRRRFVQHLVFGVHFHTFIFIALAARELSQLARNLVLLRIFEFAAMIAIATYGLLAFRRVYRESWPRVLSKALGIATLYAIAGICALLVTVIWAVTVG